MFNKQGFTLLEVVIVMFLLSLFFLGLGKSLSVLSDVNIAATSETKSRSDSYEAITSLSNSVNSLISNDKLVENGVPAGIIINDYLEVTEDVSDSAIKYIKATDMTMNLSDHVKSRNFRVEPLADYEQRDTEKMVDGRIIIENIKFKDLADTRTVTVLEDSIAYSAVAEKSKNSYFLIAVKDDQLKYIRTNLLYHRGRFSVQLIDIVLTCPQEVTVKFEDDI